MYEIFEHTADIGLRVRAENLNLLFAEAGRGLASLLIEDLQTVNPIRRHTISLQGTDRADLFVDWLRELLFLYSARHLIFVQFDVKMTENELWAQVWGETADPARHIPDQDLKAVTYHHLRLEQAPQGWIAEVILDL